MSAPLHVGLLLFPKLTQLDLTGPFELFHRIPGAQVSLMWKNTRPVRETAMFPGG